VKYRVGYRRLCEGINSCPTPLDFATIFINNKRIICLCFLICINPTMLTANFVLTTASSKRIACTEWTKCCINYFVAKISCMATNTSPQRQLPFTYSNLRTSHLHTVTMILLHSDRTENTANPSDSLQKQISALLIQLHLIVQIRRQMKAVSTTWNAQR